MTEAERHVGLGRIVLEPDDDTLPPFKPLKSKEAFPIVEFRVLLAESTKNSSRLNILASKVEVVEYFAHRFWHGRRLEQTANSIDGKKAAVQSDEFLEAKNFLRDYGYIAAKAVRITLQDKYKFEDNDLFGIDDAKLTEAYFESFAVPAFSMSDDNVAKELKRAREGGSVWEIIRMGDYAKADSLLRQDVAKLYPPHEVVIPHGPTSSLTN